MTSRILANVDSMQKLDNFSPTDLQQMLERQATEPSQDPIAKDLSKIQGKSLPIISAKSGHTSANFSMEELSLRLRELLELILDPVIPDESRMHYEQALKELISKPPRLKKGQKKYPDDYISRILIDNYALFLKMSTSYFNLSFSSLATRYLVSIIYSLECWEIYHLLLIVPNLEYTLKLLEFDIKSTSFGYIVKPPSNFLDYNLRQGLQYPFPFPFYNFSYHSVNPRAGSRKMKRITIKPYIDLRLDKSPQKPKPVKGTTKFPKLKPADTEFSYVSDSDLSSAGSEDYQKWQIVYGFVEMTPQKIMQDFDHSFVTPAQRAYEDEEYDSDRAQLIDSKEIEAAESTTSGLKIAFSVFQKAFIKANDHGLIKHTFLHQCKLMDPTSQKTCLKVFYGKNELHRHQEFVHATKKRLYRCAYCSKDDGNNLKKVYPRYDSLSRHLRRKHGIVGRENKSAVMLARRVAETEETFGSHARLLNTDSTDRDRVTLASNTGIPRSEEDAHTHSHSNRSKTTTTGAQKTTKGKDTIGQVSSPGVGVGVGVGVGIGNSLGTDQGILQSSKFPTGQNASGSVSSDFSGGVPHATVKSHASHTGNFGADAGNSLHTIPAADFTNLSAKSGPNYGSGFGGNFGGSYGTVASGSKSTSKLSRSSSISGPSSKRQKKGTLVGESGSQGQSSSGPLSSNQPTAKHSASPVFVAQPYAQQYQAYLPSSVVNESKNEFEYHKPSSVHEKSLLNSSAQITRPSPEDTGRSDTATALPKEMGEPLKTSAGVSAPRANAPGISKVPGISGSGVQYSSQYAPYGSIPSNYGASMYASTGNAVSSGYASNSGNLTYTPNSRDHVTSANFGNVAGSKFYGGGISYGQSLPVGMPGSSSSSYQFMGASYPQSYAGQPNPSHDHGLAHQSLQQSKTPVIAKQGRVPVVGAGQDARPSPASRSAVTSDKVAMPPQSRIPASSNHETYSRETFQPHENSNRQGK